MIDLVTRTRTVITALSCLSVLALGACSGDDPQPRFSPPSSSAPPPSPSTTAASGPTEPTMPAAAKGTDVAAAEAFVEFYWEMVNYAQETGDVAGLELLSTPQCIACREGLKYLDKVFSRDGEIAGGRGRVSGADTTFMRRKGVDEAVVDFTLTTTSQRVVYPGIGRGETYPGGRTMLRAVLAESGDSWLMTYWDEQ